MTTRDIALQLDEQDPLRDYRKQFSLPENTVYLDGNSLGPLPTSVGKRVQHTLTEEWGRDLITSWNKHSWIDLPQSVGDKIAPLLGAAPGQVICCDSISVNLFKLLAATLKLNPGRHTVLSQTDNFPTDLYVAQDAGPYALWIYARALLADEDHEMPVLPGGTLRLDRIEDITVSGPQGPQTVTSYALSGMELNPTYFLLDESNAFFAVMSPRFAVVREGFEPADAKIRKLAETYAAKRFEETPKRRRAKGITSGSARARATG